MKAKRHQMRKRQELEKRGLRPGIDDTETTYVIHAEAPKYDFLKNDTCILAPEITQGPYWYPPHEVLRQDMTENEVGVPLELEIGIMDVHSCLPLDNVLLSLWHCNASGSYSSFDYDPNTPFETLLKEHGIDDPSGYDNWAVSVTSVKRQDWILIRIQFLSNSDTTFLRGMWPTDEHGVSSFKSIFPGFYVRRTYLDFSLTRKLMQSSGRPKYSHPRPSVHQLARSPQWYSRIRPSCRDRTALLSRRPVGANHVHGAIR